MKFKSLLKNFTDLVACVGLMRWGPSGGSVGIPDSQPGWGGGDEGRDAPKSGSFKPRLPSVIIHW